MSLPKLVMFAGYSNSGKTTHAIPILESLGYTILSSSVLLHNFAENLVANILQYPDYDSYDRAQEIFLSCQASNSKLITESKWRSREFLITLTESCLVETFTRAVFVNALADIVIKDSNIEKKYAVETFNVAERSFFTQRMMDAGSFTPVCFNLRRRGERPGVDGRNLLPMSADIWNDGNYDDLKGKITKYLSTLRHDRTKV